MDVIKNDAPVNNGRYGRYNGRWIRLIYPFKNIVTRRTDPTEETQRIIIGCNNNISLRIIGGNFVEDDLIDTQSTVKNLEAGEHTIYVSNTASTIYLYNPGAITKIDFGSDEESDTDKFQFRFDLSSLVDMTSLTTLNLKGLSCVTGSIHNLAYLTELTTVDIGESPYITGDLSDLSRLTKLTTLDLAKAASITGDLSHLERFTNLIKLKFGAATNVTGNLKSLSGLISIKDLDIGGNVVVGSFDDISAFTLLTKLGIHSESISLTLSQIAALTNLIKLDLSNCTSVTGALSDLSTMPNLTDLNLSGCSKVTVILSKLKNLPSLKYANLLSTSVSGTCTDLSTLTNLVSLELNSSAITGALSSLNGLTSLKKLHLVGCTNNKFTGSINDLSSLTNLTSLSLESNCQGASGQTYGLVGTFSHLRGLKKLKSLTLVNSGSTTGHSFNGALSALAELEHLTNLTLSAKYDNQITGDLSGLAALKNLTCLSLTSLSLTGSLSSLNSLTNLTTVSLLKGKFTGDLSDLNQLNNLISLNLNGGCTNVTGVASSMNVYAPKLRSFDYNNTQITGTWTRISD